MSEHEGVSQSRRGEIVAFLGQWQNENDIRKAEPRINRIACYAVSKDKTLTKDLIVRNLAKKALQIQQIFPLKCNFEVISTCMLKCGFCDLHDLKDYRRATRMTFDDFLKIWHDMELVIDTVEFTGGEPLLNKDVFAMIKEANRTGVYTILTTNGNLLTDQIIVNVVDAQPRQILIAYDGLDYDQYAASRTKGNFAQLNRNIRALVEQRRDKQALFPEITLQMVVNKNNYQSLDAFWVHAKELGVDSACAKPLFVWPAGSKDFKQKLIDQYLPPSEHPMCFHKRTPDGSLLPTRREGFCPNQQQVHIGSGGEVIPCWYLLKDTFVAGYANEDSFIHIWESSAYRNYRQRMAEENVNPGCEYCIGVAPPEMFPKKIFNKI